MIEKYTVKKWYDESAIYYKSEIFAIVDVRNQANKICDRLNELVEENKRLKNENEQLKQREERLLSEIDDFQELLSKNDNVCFNKVVNLIEDKLAFLYKVKGDLINEDIYRLGQISFAITVLRELKMELKGDGDD